MADIYVPLPVPEEYDPAFITEELRRIAAMLGGIEVPFIVLVAQHVEPAKLFDDLVVNADGTDWNPGSGAGLYQRVGGAWVKL